MTYSFGGFTFTFTLDSNGNVVQIDAPQIGPSPPTTIAFNPSVPVLFAQTVAQAIVNAYTNG